MSLSAISAGFAKGRKLGGIAAAAGEAVHWIKDSTRTIRNSIRLLKRVNFVPNSCNIYTNKLTVFFGTFLAVVMN